MRIIGGEFRGRLIQAPPGSGTRPMLDRVRQALFSWMGERCDGERVLDLFSGSGSLGLEALSRGAASARFVERDPRAFRVLEGNLASLGVGERARAVRGDALHPGSWSDAAQTPPDDPRYDLVFYDPPYAMLALPAERHQVLQALERLIAGRLAPDGKLVFHAPKGRCSARDFEPAFDHALREYGSNAIWLLAPATMDRR